MLLSTPDLANFSQLVSDQIRMWTQGIPLNVPRFLWLHFLTRKYISCQEAPIPAVLSEHFFIL